MMVFASIIQILMFYNAILFSHQLPDGHQQLLTIYILLGDIISSLTSPFHIQFNFWNFHISSTKFLHIWYLL